MQKRDGVLLIARQRPQMAEDRPHRLLGIDASRVLPSRAAANGGDGPLDEMARASTAAAAVGGTFVATPKSRATIGSGSIQGSCDGGTARGTSLRRRPRRRTSLRVGERRSCRGDGCGGDRARCTPRRRRRGCGTRVERRWRPFLRHVAAAGKVPCRHVHGRPSCGHCS
jgi:hypothetical protein